MPYRPILIVDDEPANLAGLRQILKDHYEKWDGSGYPDGLSQLEIPESTRIMAIADMFDALSMQRSYKDA